MASITSAAIKRHLEDCDKTLSRSVVRGVAETQVSASKLPPLVSGQQMREQIARNRSIIAEYVSWRQKWFCDSVEEHTWALLTIGQMTLMGLAPRGLLRRWEYDPADVGVTSVGRLIGPAEIVPELGRLGSKVLESRDKDTTTRLGRVAELEWEIVVGPVHPFYDGCGRASRYYSTLASLWLEVPLPAHRSRELYFDAARRGIEAFRAYYLRAAAG